MSVLFEMVPRIGEWMDKLVEKNKDGISLFF